jgi:PhnB protein
MPAINPYIRFNGNCRQAMEFYRSIFNTELLYAGTFEDLPPEYGVGEEHHHLIMHASLPIGEGTVLFASDTSDAFGPAPTVGDNFSLSVKVDSVEEADKVFAALSEGGQVQMPMMDTFWGSYFGTLVDQFGIHWMVGYDHPQENQ